MDLFILLSKRSVKFYTNELATYLLKGQDNGLRAALNHRMQK